MQLNWGIIGAGAIAKAFAVGARTSKTGKLVAVASREKAKADKFAAEYGVPTAYGSYDELLADPQVQAVYACVPHPMHAQWAIAALEAGKHVLCEKPFTLNYFEAMKVIEVARAKGLLVMEAFMYRCHPQTAKLVELLRQKVIGDVRVIQASFSFNAGFNADSRLFSNELAGGGIMDVGCYPVSLVRLVAGVAMGRDFAEPTEIKGCGQIGQTGVDEWAAGTLKFPGGILAQISAGVRVNQDRTLRIFGSEGQISVPDPWVANREKGDAGRITVQKHGSPTQEIEIPVDRTSFSYELDFFGQAVADSAIRPAHPAMSNEDSLGNMRVLDSWRNQVGVVYEQEKPQNYLHTISRQPLGVKKNNMPYATLAGIDKEISRLVMGVDNQFSIAHAAVMFDDWFERGGNCFDTAYVYGGGLCEIALGWWVKNRGVRKELVIIGKGAHTPCCDPRNLTNQLHQSLERQHTDYFDIYMMHRDNLAIPVGEFVEVLNEHVKAGRIKVFGGSNWTLTRVDEANAYAKAHGLQGFGMVSNNFALSHLLHPMWAGCIQSSDATSRKWFTERQMPLFPWSSQGRGFFVEGNAAPDKKDDPDLMRWWYSDDNFKRLERARELARKRGCLPINIALAYVLCQPFPTFPLIGPRNLWETRTSLKALEIQLSPQELAWLSLDE